MDSRPTAPAGPAEGLRSAGLLRIATLVAALVLFLVAGHLYGYLRAAVAVLMFALILAWGARKLIKISNSPPEPELTDVKEYGLRYVCSVCGLELKVEVAARDKAPTHCGEAMVLTRDGGRPPLRPV
ncbi:MAG: hypothetical protein M3P01_00745 [Actinomycetota bacterium]|nr:hypothetical protein [Actinomycetota bacterium]